MSSPRDSKVGIGNLLGIHSLNKLAKKFLIFLLNEKKDDEEYDRMLRSFSMYKLILSVIDTKRGEC